MTLQFAFGIVGTIFGLFSAVAWHNRHRIDAIALAVICAVCLALGKFMENMG